MRRYIAILLCMAVAFGAAACQPTPEQAFSKLLPRIHPGAVVLLHSTSSTNAEILDELLTKWEETGYSFGDLEAYCAAQKTS